MKNLILIGGGGHCKSCIDVIELSGEYEIKGILDMPDKIGEKVLGYEIIGSDRDLRKYTENNYFLVTVGQVRSPDLKTKLYEEVKNAGGKLATIISPRTYVSKHAEIGQGTIIMHNSVINANTQIGNNCIINTNAIVEHDCIVQDNCHISVFAILCGQSQLGEGSFVGANSTVINCVNVPPRSFVKAGSIYK